LPIPGSPESSTRRPSPDGVLTGLDTIKQSLEEYFKNDKNTSFTIDIIKILDTNTAAGTGTFAGVYSDKSGPVNLRGHWTETFVRRDGKWKIVINTWNMSQ
jgi:hypothetical protein